MNTHGAWAVNPGMARRGSRSRYPPLPSFPLAVRQSGPLRFCHFWRTVAPCLIENGKGVRERKRHVTYSYSIAATFQNPLEKGKSYSLMGVDKNMTSARTEATRSLW